MRPWASPSLHLVCRRNTRKYPCVLRAAKTLTFLNKCYVMPSCSRMMPTRLPRELIGAKADMPHCWGMPRKDPEQPLLAPQAPSRGSSISGISALAPHLIQKSVRRVGFIGLIAALTAPASYLVERAFQPERVVLPGTVPFPAIV